jgi:hypothetical protein
MPSLPPRCQVWYPLLVPPFLATRQEDRERVPARPSLRSPCRCCPLLLISASGSVGKDTDRQWSGVRANVIAMQKLLVSTPVLVYYHGKCLVALNADNDILLDLYVRGPITPVQHQSGILSRTGGNVQVTVRPGPDSRDRQNVECRVLAPSRGHPGPDYR